MEKHDIKNGIIKELNARGIFPKAHTLDCLLQDTEKESCEGCDSQAACKELFEAISDVTLKKIIERIKKHE